MREKSAAIPTEVLAFLAICLNPLLAVLGARKLIFLKTIKIFVVLLWTNEIKRYK